MTYNKIFLNNTNNMHTLCKVKVLNCPLKQMSKKLLSVLKSAQNFKENNLTINQMVLKASACMIFGTRRGDHVTPLLKDNLHWLCIPEHVHLQEMLV